MLPIFFTVFKEGWDAFYHLRILLASNKCNWAKCWNSILSHSFLTGVKLFSIVLHIHTKCNQTVAQKQRPRRAILTSFINWCHVSSFVFILFWWWLSCIKKQYFSHWQITYQWKVTSSYLQCTALVIFYQNLTESVSVTW